MADTLADRIRRAAEYWTDLKDIASAFGIPEEVVRGVLSGTVTDEELAAAAAPGPAGEVRAVVAERYVRSRVVGVVSGGGCGAATFAAAFAVAAARMGVKTAAVDLRECGGLAPALGLDLWGESAVGYPNVLAWRSPADEVEIEHPEVPGLAVVGGAENLERWLTLDLACVRQMLEALARRWALVVVSCPVSPAAWAEVLAACDVGVLVLRRDPASFRSAVSALAFLRGRGLQDRLFAVCSGLGFLGEGECRRIAARDLRVLLLGVLPHFEGDAWRAVSGRKEPYALEVAGIAAGLLGLERQERRRLFAGRRRG